MDNQIEYDLIVICYGQNDINENFGIYYEALIRAAKYRYPRAVECFFFCDDEEFAILKIMFDTGKNIERKIGYVNNRLDGKILDVHREIKVVFGLNSNV
ncbi:hypothetical protein [Butyrivibrio sp. WCE2006]|uniref:hypothetical protein n=1 Tax=Butyrivibrio sp. WCE2006 TaxID=1410611 RepID=UPI0005D259E3